MITPAESAQLERLRQPWRPVEHLNHDTKRGELAPQNGVEVIKRWTLPEFDDNWERGVKDAYWEAFIALMNLGFKMLD